MAGDIFDMLLTFTDFLAFKEMFLDYRAVSMSRRLFLLAQGLFFAALPESPKTVWLQEGAVFTQRLYQGQKENNFTEWLLKVHV